MRLLFAHDHRFQRAPAGEVYTLGSFPAAVWDRFLEYFADVDVIARDGGVANGAVRLARADRPGVEFEFLPNLSSFGQLVAPSGEATARMRQAVAQADAVVARLPSEVGLMAVRHAQQLGKPYAVEVVGCAWDSYFNNGAASARLYAPLAFVRMRRAVRDAPLALYVTTSWLQGRYPSNGHRGSASNVSLLPLEPEQLARREQRLRAIKEGQKPVLGTVASLQVMSKGVQTAIEAIARLRQSGLDLDYRVLGPGDSAPWQQRAERLGVADLVHFDGTRSAGEEVCRWLDAIDIHLQPSFQEGLPRATIEAMSRGAACLGSTCGGIPELLPAERVHRPGDAAALSEKIRRLADHPDALAAASRADLGTAQSYSAEQLQERRSAFYARLHALASNVRRSARSHSTSNAVPKTS